MPLEHAGEESVVIARPDAVRFPQGIEAGRVVARSLSFAVAERVYPIQSRARWIFPHYQPLLHQLTFKLAGEPDIIYKGAL